MTKKQGVDIHQVVLSLYNKGYNWFLCGVTDEIGLTPIRDILKVQEMHDDIELTAIISPTTKREEFAKFLFETSDAISITSEEYFKEAFCTKNEFLINSGAEVVCHTNDGCGATIYAFTEISIKGLGILNLFDYLNEDSPFNR